MMVNGERGGEKDAADLAQEGDVGDESRVHDNRHVARVEEFNRVVSLLTAVPLKLDLRERASTVVGGGGCR